MAKKKKKTSKKKSSSKKDKNDNIVNVEFKDGTAPTDAEREKIRGLFKDFKAKSVERLMDIFMNGDAEGACIAAEKRLSDLMAIECGVDDELEPEDVVLDVRAVKDSAGAIA